MRVGPRARDERGFTLVESAVAGALIVIGILGGISVFDSSRRESATGERQELATLQAQAELERVRDVPYAELGLDPASAQRWQASGAPGDPTARVGSGTPGTFQAGPDQAEDLVFATADGAGIDPQSSFSLDAGDSTLDFDVYRFVSWRDEECPVADASGVLGPLDGLTDTTTSLLGTLLGTGSVLNELLGPLFGILDPVVGDRLRDAEATLVGIRSDLAGLVAALEAVDEIDPCDADVATLQEAEETLAPVNPLLTELDSRINAYRADCVELLGVVVSCPGSSSSLWTNLNAAITNVQDADLETALADLADSLGELAAADHTHNTKRVTVAVVLEPQNGSGPMKPVWATSVVSDASEGLLAGP